MKELRRSRTNRIIAGVCGGIGEYLDINANVIRLVWIVATVFTLGIGIIAYLFAWLVIPEQVSSAPAGTATSGTSAGPGTDQNR